MTSAATQPELEISIRSVRDSDWNFILSSWKQSYRDSEPMVPNHIYFAEMHARIEHLKQGGARFLVACDPNDQDFIVGWLCDTPDGALHYVYVRQSMRLADVAKRLSAQKMRARMGGGSIVCTHWTKASEEINKKHPGVLRYEPSLLK
jgi:hypothetical protein